MPFASLMGMRFEAPFYTLFQAVKAGVVGEPRLIQTQKSYRLGARPDYYFRRETYGGYDSLGGQPCGGSHLLAERAAL